MSHVLRFLKNHYIILNPFKKIINTIARKLSINRPYFKDMVYFILRDWKEGKMKSAIAPYARQVGEPDCVGHFGDQEHKINMKPTTSANCPAQG